jgi:GDP-L-fucose synthase
MSGAPDPAFWTEKKVTVTGGAGFLGKPTIALLEGLRADLTTIRSADFDLRDREACVEALRGAEVVIHLAATQGHSPTTTWRWA